MKWLYASHIRLEPGLPASQMLPLAGGRMPTEGWMPGQRLAGLHEVQGLDAARGPLVREDVQGNQPLIRA